MAPGVLVDEADMPPASSEFAGSLCTSKVIIDRNRLCNIQDAPMTPRNYLLGRNARKPPLKLVDNRGNWLSIADGRGANWKVFDASGGAGVSSIGHRNPKIMKAMHEAIDDGLFYAPSLSFETDPCRKMAEMLVLSTDKKMGSVVFYSSGSEGVEAAKKFARHWHAELKPEPEPSRQLFIARKNSYHGATLGALELSGHETRKSVYRSNLSGDTSHISPCYSYRGLKDGETHSKYVARLATELAAEIEILGPSNVAAFVMEPVVGAALGCVPALPGYLQAMKNVCVKYGVLLIFDEVMCGMGRTGYLHAWQGENVSPDIQIVGKCLAGGYEALSAMLVSTEISEVYNQGEVMFNHGHTFQNAPRACGVALAVQKLVQDENLLANVQEKGALLQQKLTKRLGGHRNVGDIRGAGLFRGIEFVRNQSTKEPFPSAMNIAWKLHEKGLSRDYGIYIYPGQGSADGHRGDHIIIAPAYNINDGDVDEIVNRVCKLVVDFFDGLDANA
ncbi:hypothetical protein ACN47E_006521 [Coniothyrium glycines]